VQGSRTVSWNVEEGVQEGALLAEPGTGADALQLTLRFSFRARLIASDIAQDPVAISLLGAVGVVIILV
jgi:hypothetical protein